MDKIKSFITFTLIILFTVVILSANISNATSTTKVSISSSTVSTIEEKTYTGKEIKPVITVSYKGVTLVKGIDYNLSYGNNVKAGTGKIVLTGIGNFTGTKTKTFRIAKKNIDSLSINIESTQKYTGTSIKPDITVKDGNTLLTKGIDYTVTYSNNTKAGSGIVKVTGKGNYTGTIEKTFGISQLSISGATISKISNQEYTGSEILPKVTVRIGNKILSLNKDYTVSGANNINVGTATLKITGIGNYTGTISTTFNIVSKNLSKVKFSKIEDCEYTSRKISPKVEAYNGNTKLTEGTDYTVNFSNNKSVGTGKVQVTGRGNYTGTKNLTFKISKIDICEAVVSTIPTQYYTGSAIKPKIIVKHDGERLTLNEDYKVSYINNKEIGTATVKITGIGNYTSYFTTSFQIRRASSNYDYYDDYNDDYYYRNEDYYNNNNKISITKTTVSAIVDQVYTGKKITPTLYIRYNGNLLTKNTDYTLTYNNNKNVGTATVKITGKNKFTGTKTVTFKIVSNSYSNSAYTKGNISISKTTASTIYNQQYTGRAITPNVYLRYNGTLLQQGRDYTVSYSNNVNIGTAKVVITGIGNYYGTKTLSFKIVNNSYSNSTYTKGNISISKTTASTIYNQQYTGRAITPNVYLRYNGTLLQQGRDYTVSYSNNVNVGTAKVVITGIGNYYGTKTLSFKIVR